MCSSPASGTPGARWTCPKCSRSFTQLNQRHACGTSDGSDVLRNRVTHVAKLASASDIKAIQVYLKEAYDASLR